MFNICLRIPPPTDDDSVENLRPGAMEKLGIGYDVLSKVNPRIILASTSGRTSPAVRLRGE